MTLKSGVMAAEDLAFAITGINDILKYNKFFLNCKKTIFHNIAE